MANKIYDYLKQIYPPQVADETLTRLQALIADYRERIDAESVDEPFSQRDVVLITYGDTFYAADEKPLETLNRFAVERLAGVVSTIHILPFYPYSSDDGFSVKDFYAVNPALGDWDDIERIAQSFALMFDGVFNHMSAQSDWFRRFLAGEPDYAKLFYTASPDMDLSEVTRPRALPLLTPFTRPDGETLHVWTTFSPDQVDFDISEPSTLLRLIDILLFYATKGADVVRLDAICFLWKEPGTNSIHRPQTHAAVRLMRAVLNAIAPQVILITETNVPHAENISYFGDGTDEAQMVYNFTLPPLLFHTMLTGNTGKLREWINQLETPSARTTFFNFTASHDGIGVRPVEGILSADELSAMVAHVEARGGRVSYKRNPDGSQSPYELNCTYVDAVTDPAEPEALQVQRFITSQAIAMSLAGVPAVYVHSLLGSHNDIEGMEASGHNRTINRAKLELASIDAALNDGDSFRAQVFRRYVDLLAERRSLSAFHPNAAQKAIDTGNDALLAILRTAPDQQLLALFNVSGETQTADISAITSGGRDILRDEPTGATVALAPYDFAWIVF
ncbi:MAG: sugar phosphorylase [Anaerolineaceae bacterium]|nr:MAG: sugar phosphorylase [Anaerolineaceae bacterium]